MTRVFLIAGEASGDTLGGALMSGLRSLDPGAAFAGIGGAQMQAQGLTSLFPMEDLSVMGLAEVLPRYRHLVRRKDQAAAAVLAARPDVLVTIDSPDFCLRVARAVRAAAPGQRVVHYVAPSVWAWRPGRAARMARHVDQVLCLLPFEPPYMEDAGMRADFVGHPVAATPPAGPDEIEAFRAAAGLGAAPLLLVLPGSRRGEIARLLPVFGAALAELAASRPDLRVAVPTLPHLADEVLRGTAGWPGAPLVLDWPGLSVAESARRKRAAFGAARLALAASGTVSLELAAAGVPMVIAYDMAWLSWQILSRMVRLDTVTLVNLVSGTRAVPEFLGPACRPGPIAAALRTLAEDGPERDAQAGAMAATMAALGRGGPPPGLRAAQAVLDGLGAPSG